MDDKKARQARLLELTHDAVCTWRLSDGRIQYWNAGAESLYGFAKEEAQGQCIHKLLSTVDSEQLAAIERKVVEAGNFRCQLIHTTKDGSKVYVDSCLVFEPDDDEPTALEASRDITERVQVEQALRVSEERFRCFVLATAQAVVIADTKGGIKEDSPSWRDFTGQSFEQSRGPGWAAAVHPGDQDNTRAHLAESIAYGTCFEVECRLMRADGFYRWTNIRSVPVKNPDGSVREWLASVTDITDKKEAENAIRAGQERLHYALDAGAMVIWDYDLTSGLVYRAGPKIALPEMENGPVESFLRAVHAADRPALIAALTTAQDGGSPLDAEVRVVAADGEIVWIACKGQLRVDPVTSNEFLTGVATNVTKRRRAEERLKLLEAMAEAVRNTADSTDVITEATRLLGAHLGGTSYFYTGPQDSTQGFTLRYGWGADGAECYSGSYSLKQFGDAAGAVLPQKRCLVFEDLQRNLGPGERADLLPGQSAGAIICCPIVQDGKLLAVMSTHCPSARKWSAEDISVAKELTERCWAQVERVRAAEALRRSESHLQALVEQSAVGIVETDLSGRIVRTNGMFCDLIGLGRQAMLGRSLLDFAIAEDHTAFEKQLSEAVHQDVPFAVELRYRRADGRPVWVSQTVSVVHAPEQANANSVLAVIQNITERKQTEDKLLEMSGRLQLTLESAEIGEWDLDLAGNTSHRSAHYDRCFGHTEPVAEWGMEHFIKQVHPEDREEVTQRLHRAVADKSDWHFECRIIWPDESVHWIAAHGSVYQNRDEPAKVNGIVLDITARKGYEQSLRTSEQQALEAARQAEAERRRLDAVLEAVPVGIAVVNAHGERFTANPALKHLWGEASEAPTGIEDYSERRGWWADGSERHGQPVQPHEWTLARALRGEYAPHDIMEIESLESPPVRRIILGSAAPIRDNNGEILGAVVAQMDITDRINAENGLREAGRRKDEFLAMLAHELRNPLAPIGAAADLLHRTKLDEARVQKASAIISRQVKHMSGLVDDLLDVSRVTRGLVVLNKIPLDVKQVVTDAIEQVRPLIEARGHHLSLHLIPQAAFVLADQKRLVQVVANLLNNAAKYTPEGGEISLSLSIVGNDVQITLTDNGIGMTPVLVEGAFELFAQAERSSDRSQGGLGIGLALVRSLLEMHGGSALAQSDGLGRGSTFSLRLPQWADAPDDDTTSQNDSSRTLPRHRHKILIVDDNVDAAQMLEMFCEELGHQVIVEHNSSKALERAALEAPDTCLLDIGLPDMDGNELARRLRACPETTRATLVAVTGYGQDQDRLIALEAGFDYHFVKPVDTNRLAALLNGLREPS